jgi:hypothetical protein
MVCPPISTRLGFLCVSESLNLSFPGETVGWYLSAKARYILRRTSTWRWESIFSFAYLGPPIRKLKICISLPIRLLLELSNRRRNQMGCWRQWVLWCQRCVPLCMSFFTRVAYTTHDTALCTIRPNRSTLGSN